ncbi:hypothetical protein [Chlorogloea sp. CCALA 695]|uniref:hypothetical protein n=1 Tax=Chlorogloea sp. CCALA 695 TaxID=2107693 RepID=UPI000D051C5B|nr:hypothetical protein [Chlorogloea sp. CCALA 695]PSB33063.1 hypothetical protein C7B70_08400 [Chlorogloea sp. CCALA 695]
MNEASLFISSDMMNAPEHPLADNLELSMAGDVKGEKRDSAPGNGLRIPGIVKRIIPIDNTTSWEYWWCIPGQLLLPEDVALLQSDYNRVESILTKLVWLWGGRFIGDETSREVNNWSQVLELGRESKINPDVIDIDFFPLTVKTNEAQGNIGVEPAYWHIEFFQLEATDGGYNLQEPKKACGCQIWTGKPFVKQLDTEEAMISYDLGIAQPSAMTSPPWQTLLSSN